MAQNLPIKTLLCPISLYLSDSHPTSLSPPLLNSSPAILVECFLKDIKRAPASGSLHLLFAPPKMLLHTYPWLTASDATQMSSHERHPPSLCFIFLHSTYCHLTYDMSVVCFHWLEYSSGVERLKVVPHGPRLLVYMPWCNAFPLGVSLTWQLTSKQMQPGKGDRMPLPRLGYRKTNFYPTSP